MMDTLDMKNLKTIGKYITGIVIFISLVVWGFQAGARVYNVWAQSKEGQAELARAESNRQIKTLEAKAVMESAKYLADAEIIRAEGVARANKIIGDSLNNNEAYLRYLWINGLQHTQSQVVYVPTEANLPILEAQRLKR
jgi:regulator of protease activity HflC (stomatin/prohibitin superfamily)